MGQALEIKRVEVSLDERRELWYHYGQTMDEAIEKDDDYHCLTELLPCFTSEFHHDDTEAWAPLTTRVTWSDLVE